MKKNAKSVVLSAALVLICAFVFCGCGITDPAAIEGEGGIAPEGYERLEYAGSSFYIPPNCKYDSHVNGVDLYRFPDGTFNVNTVDSSAKVQRIKESKFEKDIKSAMSASGFDCKLDSFKFYKLSGLWILADELTLTERSSSKVIKEYQFCYNSSGKQVTLTIAFNNPDVAVESDFPAKLLYSIAIL
ncbi:MAG: hypothetical protein HFE35_00460 [Clostridia bacterium]|jgi:hypothetical protein|uniref:hypothetical protein n=1 Tax=Pumilibacter muris TaxID=2941510 RepID=UPI00203E5B25|nr:hypothetical protein [Pumilibacter muris]MCI8595276.1 hypothetical protein [Clostridia bacterium]